MNRYRDWNFVGAFQVFHLIVGLGVCDNDNDSYPDVDGTTSFYAAIAVLCIVSFCCGLIRCYIRAQRRRQQRTRQEARQNSRSNLITASPQPEVSSEPIPGTYGFVPYGATMSPAMPRPPDYESLECLEPPPDYEPPSYEIASANQQSTTPGVQGAQDPADSGPVSDAATNENG